MGERKVLNRYFPPDFDPALLPKRKRPETNDMKVRMMLPMSVRCKTCGTFMYKGTKFNTRKEDVMGETYLGIQVYRFYYRCKNCGAEFTMKTDPKNSDYQLEEGATRNYEHWREEEKVKTEAVKAREEEEMGNAMKALENKTLDSKREMDIMAALDEMRTLKSKHARITTEEALAALQREADKHAGSSGAHVEDFEDAMSEFYKLRRQAANQLQRESSSDDDQDGEHGVKSRASAASNGAARAQGTGSTAKAGRRTAGAGLSLAAAAMEEELAGSQDEADAATATAAQGSGGSKQADGDDGDGAGQQGAPEEAGPGIPPSHASNGVGTAGQSGSNGQASAMVTATGNGSARAAASQLQGLAVSSTKPAAVVKPQFKVVVKPKATEPATVKEIQQGGNNQSGDGHGDGDGGLAGLLGGYGSSDSGDA